MLTNDRCSSFCYLIPYNSQADVVRLLAELSDTKSNVKLGGFRFQLQAFYVSSYPEELRYIETVCPWMIIYICIYIYVWHSKHFQSFLFRHLELSWTLENSVGYCYTSYEMSDQLLWFQVQSNSYSSYWNTPYWSLIFTAGEFQKLQSGHEDTLKEWYAIKMLL